MVNEENREESMKYNVDSGFFEYNASIMEMNIGITPYTFTAISKNYSDINDKTISNLTLYGNLYNKQERMSLNNFFISQRIFIKSGTEFRLHPKTPDPSFTLQIDPCYSGLNLSFRLKFGKDQVNSN